MSAAVAVETDFEHSNDVHLVGRVAAAPVERDLPSGDRLLSFRLVVHRPPADRTSKVTVDVVECTAWLAKVRRSVASWHPGDIVEVEGALRRRFYRTPSGVAASRYAVEAKVVRRLERAPH